MSETIHLHETVFSPAAKIDREAGIVREVKVLGRESANGRSYSDQAIDDAAKLYEGSEVNIDHDRKEPHRERGLLEGFGVLRNVSRKADGVYADLHYLKSHPAAAVFLERADRFPEKIGLSHNADGKANRKGGKTVVESIQRVNSVDVVRNPATNKGLFESKESSVTKTFRQIIESFFPKTAPTCQLLEDAPMAAMPVDAPAEASSDEQIKLAFEQAVVAAFRDNKLDSKSTLKKIKEILNAYDKLTGGASDPAKPEGEGVPKMESKDPVVSKLLESFERMEAREKAREKRDEARGIMAEFKLPDDSAFLESLVKMPDTASMRSLCERESKLRPAPTGRAKPFIESRNSQADALASYPKDTKEFAAALR